MKSAPRSQELQDHYSTQCWKDVKNETGFETYLDYLEACRSKLKRSHDDLIDRLKTKDKSRHPRRDLRGYCSIWDIFEDGTTSSSIAIAPSSEAYDTDILTVLRQPPQQAILRVVVLKPKTAVSEISPRLVNAVGLGLRIIPEFFEAYITMKDHDISRKVPLDAEYGTIGSTVFTVAREYLPGMSPCPPVVLILFNSTEDFDNVSPQPALFTPLEFMNSHALECVSWPTSFKSLSSDYLKRHQGPLLSLEVAMLYTLLPLLRPCLYSLRKVYDDVNIKYLRRTYDFRTNLLALEPETDNLEEGMEDLRFILRRQVRRYEQCMSDIQRYLRKQDIKNPEQYEAFLLVIKESHDCLNSARSLEAEIRDWLQLRVGNLALQESKKSIQLSNMQIKDSKRGMMMLSKPT